MSTTPPSPPVRKDRSSEISGIVALNRGFPSAATGDSGSYHLEVSTDRQARESWMTAPVREKSGRIARAELRDFLEEYAACLDAVALRDFPARQGLLWGTSVSVSVDLGVRGIIK